MQTLSRARRAPGHGRRAGNLHRRMPGCPDARMPGCPDARMPGCPDARMPGCPDARMPGCPDARMPGCPDARMPGCPDARMPGCPDARMPGCPDARMPGCPDARMPGCPDARMPGCPDARIKADAPGLTFRQPLFSSVPGLDGPCDPGNPPRLKKPKARSPTVAWTTRSGVDHAKVNFWFALAAGGRPGCPPAARAAPSRDGRGLSSGSSTAGAMVHALLESAATEKAEGTESHGRMDHPKRSRRRKGYFLVAVAAGGRPGCPPAARAAPSRDGRGLSSGSSTAGAMVHAPLESAATEKAEGTESHGRIMRWTPPADGIEVPRWSRETTTNAGDVREASYHDRAGHRQERVPGARCRCAGPGGAQKAPGARQGAGVFRQPAALCDRPRGLRRRALTGPAS